MALVTGEQAVFAIGDQPHAYSVGSGPLGAAGGGKGVPVERKDHLDVGDADGRLNLL